MTQADQLDSGRFYNFTKLLIEEDYPFEKDMLSLIGLYDGFIMEASSIGSNACSEFILNGTNGHTARDLAFEEIRSFVADNIVSY
jgi:hypothetical protein